MAGIDTPRRRGCDVCASVVHVQRIEERLSQLANLLTLSRPDGNLSPDNRQARGRSRRWHSLGSSGCKRDAQRARGRAAQRCDDGLANEELHMRGMEIAVRLATDSGAIQRDVPDGVSLPFWCAEIDLIEDFRRALRLDVELERDVVLAPPGGGEQIRTHDVDVERDRLLPRPAWDRHRGDADESLHGGENGERRNRDARREQDSRCEMKAHVLFKCRAASRAFPMATVASLRGPRSPLMTAPRAANVIVSAPLASRASARSIA
jgi:hypothetical protein